MARSSARPRDQATIKSLVLPEETWVEGELRYKTVEGEVDKRHRHRMEARAFWIKEAPVHIVGAAIIVASAIFSFWVLSRAGAPKDDREWAKSMLTYLLVAIAGFAYGKAAK